MRNPSWLMPVAILFVCIVAPNPAEAGDEPPTCGDEQLIATSIEAVENFYTANGLAGDDIEKAIIKSLRGLNTGDPEDARRKVQFLANAFGIKKEQVRVCYGTPIAEDYIPQVLIIMNPDNPNDWGLIVQNLMIMDLQAVWGWLTG